MMQLNRRLVWGTFRNLEPAFLDEMRMLRAKSPLAPCAVLVPNHLLRVHLSRALANSGCPHANVHFLTTRNLADRLASSVLAGQGRTTIPPFTLRLAMFAAMQQLSADIKYFTPVAKQHGFHEAMLATIQDLKEAGTTPETIELAARRLPVRGPQDATRKKLTEIAKIWKFIERIKNKHRFYDETDLFAAAANEAPNSCWTKSLTHMTVYGFYDLTGSQRHLLEACFRDMPVTVYFPFEESIAFEYAKPTLGWFESIGFHSQKGQISPDTRPGTLQKLQRCLFSRAAHTKAEDPSTDPNDLLILSAPGEAREAEEVLREIVHPPPGSAYKRYGVLMRSHLTYTEMLRHSLDAMDVQGYFHSSLPLAQTLCGKALLLLLDLMGTQYKRADVMDFTAIVKPKNAAQWNQFTIDAAIVEGREEWLGRLRQFRSKFENRQARGDEGARDVITSLDALHDFLTELFDELDYLSSQGTWRAIANSLERALTLFGPVGEDAPQVLSQLRQISHLDLIGVEPSHEHVRSFLHEALDKPRRSAGKFGQNEPTVAALMEARGVPFDVVIIPGMVERAFPLPTAQDPILLDSEREVIARMLSWEGHPVLLPLKRWRRREEELLFALAVGAAQKRLVLTFPRIDAQSARPRIPSPFLLKVLEAVTGQYADFDHLEKFVRSEHGKYVPLSRLDVSTRDHALSVMEYDLSSLAKALQEETPDALLYLTQATPFFERALSAETARWANPDFTAHDGVVCDPKLLGRLPDELHDLTSAVSPSHLEQYARCPFAYFLKYVLRIDPVEEPERIGVVSAMDRGSIVHGILWQFFSELAEKGQLPLTGDHLPRLLDIAEQRFKTFEKRGVSGYPLTWKIETDRILLDLAQFLERELSEKGPFVPRHFEVRFGMQRHDREESPISTEDPVPFAMGKAKTITFCGKIDRIDVDPAAGNYRVMDYKTGRAPRQKDNSFCGGTALQLPIYLIAAENILESGQAHSAEYYHATSRGNWKHVKFTSANWPETIVTLRSILKTITDGIRSGKFYAYPSGDSCKWCDFRGACGHGRLIEYKWQADTQATRDFIKMTEIK